MCGSGSYIPRRVAVSATAAREERPAARKPSVERPARKPAARARSKAA